MGGALTVESVFGEGSTFRVVLPVATVAPTTIAPVEPNAEIGEHGRILIVDDEVLVVRSIHRALRDEHDVMATTAAADALELVAPGQASRMIFLTGGAFTANARRFLAESTNEHLEKPFSPSNLRAIAQRYLRSRPPSIEHGYASLPFA